MKKNRNLINSNTDFPGRRLLSLLMAVTLTVMVKTDVLAQESALQDTEIFRDIKQINAGVLHIGYVDIGPSDGKPVILLHGWPYDINSYAKVAPVLAQKGYRVIIPHLRGFGSTRFLSKKTLRNGQQGALAKDVIALMDALRIKKAIIGGFDWGGRSADVVAAIWPERCTALVSVSGYLIGSQAANINPLAPAAELSWWYQYYFSTARGRAGYAANTKAFAKLIWHTASPHWNFSDDEFERSATSFQNPDHVAIVIYNYRWRLGIEKGEQKYDLLEKQLAGSPKINVPTVTLEGDANGAPHPEPKAYREKFTGKYMHHSLTGGIGHNLPQEAPQAFIDAIIEADKM